MVSISDTIYYVPLGAYFIFLFFEEEKKKRASIHFRNCAADNIFWVTKVVRRKSPLKVDEHFHDQSKQILLQYCKSFKIFL